MDHERPNATVLNQNSFANIGDFQYHAEILRFAFSRMDEFDFVVVGSGPGGYIAAIRAAQLGYSVGLVERETNLGGVCLNWGCIPTKSLLKSAELYKKLQTAGQFGIFTSGNIRVDIAKVVERSRVAVEKLNHGVASLMKKHGITVITGTAKLTGSNKIQVADTKNVVKTVTARHIILATGSRPRPSPELDPSLIWTARDAMVPKELPRSLLIIGSGAIGIEFASFYSTLGSKVTIVEMQDRILPLEDHTVSDAMCKILKANGIDIILNSSVKTIHKHSSGIVASVSGSTGEILCDKVICAIGVVPNSTDIGLNNTNSQLDSRGFIITDEHCATSEPGLYAIGDVAGPPCLAHKASHEAIICVESIAARDGKLSGHIAKLNKSNIPSCIYSIPQVASVGLTEQQAKEQGLDYKVGISRAYSNGKAIVAGSDNGFVKVIISSTTGELLGAHMLGDEVTEMINGFIVGRQLETTDVDLAHTIFPHPTISEMMHSAILGAWDRPLDC